MACFSNDFLGTPFFSLVTLIFPYAHAASLLQFLSFSSSFWLRQFRCIRFSAILFLAPGSFTAFFALLVLSSSVGFNALVFTLLVFLAQTASLHSFSYFEPVKSWSNLRSRKLDLFLLISLNSEKSELLNKNSVNS